MDVVTMFPEQANSELTRRKRRGFIFADRPTGDQRGEELYLSRCLQSLQTGTPFVKYDGWVVAASLTLEGGTLVVPEALIAIGAIEPAQPVDWKPLLWHLYVWDMSFLVWGVLFGIATWHFSRTTSDPKELNV
jgi:hypothetical protein